MARFVFGDRSASSSVLVSAVSASLQVPRRQSCALPSENARSLIIQCAHDLESRTPETTSDPRWRGECSPRWQGPDGKRASPDGLRGAEPCTRSSGRAVAAGMDYADFARSSAHYAAEQRRGPRDRCRCGASHRRLGSKLSRLSGRLLNGWALVRIQPVPQIDDQLRTPSGSAARHGRAGACDSPRCSSVARALASGARGRWCDSTHLDCLDLMPARCGLASVRSGARFVSCPGWTRNVL